MTSVVTPSGITVEFDGPDDIIWGLAKEIANRMSNPSPEDIEFALGVMLKGWSGSPVAGLEPPRVEYHVEKENSGFQIKIDSVNPNGLLSLKMRQVNELAEVIMAAATAEGKETETGTPSM